MKKKITLHLIKNPSYFKWSASRLAFKFNCSPNTVRRVIRELEDVKKAYLQNF